MGFREQLEGLVNSVDGAVAASVMGMDGIAIDTVEASASDDLLEIDIQTLLVEYTAILSQLVQAGEVLETGGLKQLAVETERLLTLSRRLTDEYYAVLAVLPDANYGKARYKLRIASSMLAAEL
ncbi:MAG: hypothetical protein P1V51_17825 [Deltaproteobacteria bacterium]|nr:hypothetical protein [Deltaproteobacteria bacterium]